MTNFVNIRLANDELLDPMLKLLVDKLAMDNPRWVFTKQRENVTKRSIAWSYRMTEEEQKAHEAPDGFHYVRNIKVTHNDEQLGAVMVDELYSRRGGSHQHWQYGVKSWRVEKSRGARDITYTTKMDMAVRHVKKLFKPMDHNETYNKAQDVLLSKFNDAAATLMYPIKTMSAIKSGTALQAYALLKALGEPIESPDLLEIERQLQSDAFKQAMGEYFLAREMASHHQRDMRVVVAMGGNQYLFKDDEYNLLCLDFEHLPERMQNNISVLHLMQDNEIVRYVGYRYNSTHFYICK